MNDMKYLFLFLFYIILVNNTVMSLLRTTSDDEILIASVYKEIENGYIIFLIADKTIGSTFYKASDFSTLTDDLICHSECCFASYGCKFPLIIIGLDTAVVMKSYDLKGIYYDKVIL